MSERSVDKKLEQYNEEIKQDRGVAPGRTGKYPDGKITADDKGEIVIAVREDEGFVIFAYGGGWFGFDPVQAVQVAQCLHGAAFRAAAEIVDSQGQCECSKRFQEDPVKAVRELIEAHDALCEKVQRIQSYNNVIAEGMQMCQINLDTASDVSWRITSAKHGLLLNLKRNQQDVTVSMGFRDALRLGVDVFWQAFTAYVDRVSDKKEEDKSVTDDIIRLIQEAKNRLSRIYTVSAPVKIDGQGVN